MNKMLETMLSIGLGKSRVSEEILDGLIREELYEEMKFDLRSKG